MVPGEDDRLCGCRRAVVMGRVAHVHARKGANQALVLENSLERPLGNFRLVRGIGRVELTAAKQHIHSRRDVVVISPGTQETEHILGCAIGSGNGFKLIAGLHFGHARGQVQTREAKSFRDLLEEIFQFFDPDGFEHHLHVII